MTPAQRPVAQWSAVTPGYFQTLGVPIVAGREFTERDIATVPRVAVVSQNLARQLWPNENPIGKRMFVARTTEASEVVGIAADIRNNGLARAPEFAMYSPYAQRPWTTMRLIVRTTNGDPMRMAGAIRGAVQAIDPDQPVTQIQSMDARLADSIAQSRLITILLGAFAVVALIMSAAGLYGVVAGSVTRRSREIGVRVALGATPQSIWRSVLIEGLRLTLAGVGLGVMAAAAGARVLSALLVGITPLDGPTYGVGSAIFVGVALAACAVPARRALRVDPVVALRNE